MKADREQLRLKDFLRVQTEKFPLNTDWKHEDLKKTTKTKQTKVKPNTDQYV